MTITYFDEPHEGTVEAAIKHRLYDIGERIVLNIKYIESIATLQVV